MIIAKLWKDIPTTYHYKVFDKNNFIEFSFQYIDTMGTFFKAQKFTLIFCNQLLSVKTLHQKNKLIRIKG